MAAPPFVGCSCDSGDEDAPAGACRARADHRVGARQAAARGRCSAGPLRSGSRSSRLLEKVSRDARLSVRLAPEDRILLSGRATARGMPSATYVSVLVRSHLRNLAPAPQGGALGAEAICGGARGHRPEPESDRQGCQPGWEANWAGTGGPAVDAQGSRGASRPREGVTPGKSELVGTGVCRDDSLTSGAASRSWISPATPVAGLVAGTACRMTKQSSLSAPCAARRKSWSKCLAGEGRTSRPSGAILTT